MLKNNSRPPKKGIELFWSERISKKELYDIILESTRNFIKMFCPSMSCFTKLEDKYMKAKEIYESYN